MLRRIFLKSSSRYQLTILSKLCKQRSLRNYTTMDNTVDMDSNEIAEGQAKVLTPKSVFYNPVQEFNRDLTISVISEFVTDHYESQKAKEVKSRKRNENLQNQTNEVQVDDSVASRNPDNVDIKMETEADEKLKAGVSYPDGIQILEGLAASGLRSVRFGLEIPGVKEVIANDFDKNAVSFIEKNIARNNLDGIVRPNCGDAAMVMYQHKAFKDRFDVIDLDPYGSPSVFLDSAVQAVRDGGLLCITCTDMAVLCGNSGETCYSKYGSMSLKAKFCHEMALRIILQSIESAANRYSRYIEPLISISADFYVRVFVKVFTGQIKVKQSVTKLAYVYHCTGCGSFVLQKLANKVPTKGDNFKFTPAVAPNVEKTCEHCGFKQHIGGPVWADPIHDNDFVSRVIKRVTANKERFGTSERILGMLNVVNEELNDAPLYYKIDEICNVLHCTAPSIVQFRSALLNTGYRGSLSHAAKNCHKTDAPAQVVWDIMRAWVKDHPVKADHLRDGTPAKAILEQEPSIEVNFDPHPDANPKSRQQGLLRWQINPERDWGPKPRAKKTDNGESMSEKRENNRGKRKAKQETVNFVDSVRGGRSLYFAKNKFRLNRQKDDTGYWVCTEPGCSARLVTIGDRLQTAEYNHNHPNPSFIFEVDSFKAKLIYRAKTEMTPIPQIYDTEIANLREQHNLIPEGLLQAIPPFQSLKTILYRQRHKTTRPSPASSQDTMNEEWTESDGEASSCFTQSTGQSGSPLKQYSCKKYKTGECDRGDNCCYSHQHDDSPQEDDSVTVKVEHTSNSESSI